MLSKPVLYLDLDGTVRQGLAELGRFVNGPEDVFVFPEAIARMKAWRKKGGLICGVTNQGGVALGYLTKAQCLAGIQETYEQTGKLFDVISICMHHPDSKDPEEARCWCRKPCAGAVVIAAEALSRVRSVASIVLECYPPHLALFVGDRPEDRECASDASIDFMYAADWRASGTS